MIRLTKSLALLCLMVLVSATSLKAQPPKTPEQMFVYKVAEDVLEVIKAHPSSSEASQKLEGVFNQYVDIDWVGRFVLGRHWRAASDTQRQEFSDSYRRFMVSSYTKRLQKYSGQHYEVSAPRDLGKDRSALTMEVFQPSGSPILIDYKIREDGDGFKIYDLVVEGVSLISTQRSEFDAVVNRRGLDYLIKALKKKTSKSA